LMTHQILYLTEQLI